MPKKTMVEVRSDFRGGLNTKSSVDQLRADELRLCRNGRLSGSSGAVVKRLGSRRVHTTALGAAVRGIYQWDAPGVGKQLVAIADGDLWHKASDYGEFTNVSSTLSTTVPPYFATMRQSTSGAPLRLYLGEGGTGRRWSGSALASVGALTKADLLMAYHTRLFWRDTDFQQTLKWTVLGDPESGTTGLEDGAGAAMVDVLRGEPLVAMTVVGGSLLLATTDSISRFRGYSGKDIQIEQDTEGVSATVGIVGPLALAKVETVAVGLDKRGPHLITEAQVQAMGLAVEPEFNALDRTALAGACIGYNAARREVLFAVPGSGDGGLNKTVYVYNLALNSWSGPFLYPFGITCFASVEDTNGDQTVLAGCSDGFVRNLDTGTLDDVLADGTGGNTYQLQMRPGELWFETGPGMLKTLRGFSLEANVPGEIELRYRFDGGPWQSIVATGPTGGVVDSRIDAYGQGKRFEVEILSEDATTPEINGILCYAYDMKRWE